ncbi:RluA family pseudouridine synthase [Longimicrobium terrae]|uniref:Pseudouridine synthase n=1 Tax=Longimicrobium terrae TaxID=1639882 RepID=A0A841H5S8_9BACT|nr:RluA family pseudouridine synthase [Longimicrobium terrae]MBB4639176.1 RluA family pseudouridine synthase [Longimicrobium terrae]MBB6073420.1 RluA family pseudouridine synthase [Longimicrobium terrae]NNC32592.1 RluA family pseudouridine synthase [Longimicrobium terrae]
MPQPAESGRKPQWVKHTVTADEAGRTLQQLLTETLGISGRMIQRLTRSRGVQMNRKPGWLAGKVKAGDLVEVRLVVDEEPGLTPVEMPLSIVAEDEDLLVIDKPPFVLVHPTSPGQDRTLAHGVAWHLQQRGIRARVHPVHRIDRDTSGLVLFARTAHAHHRLDLQLRAGELKREYLALVDGVVTQDRGMIDAPIARDPRNPTLRVTRPNGEPALTRYEVVERYPNATLVRLELETGRTHQIRVHMQHAGHPVLGDRQYGRRRVDLVKRQALHAERLAFTHPATGAPVELRAPLAEDLRAAIEVLKNETARG